MGSQFGKCLHLEHLTVNRLADAPAEVPQGTNSNTVVATKLALSNGP